MCFDYSEGYNEFYNEKLVKTRRVHKCDACHKLFPIGPRMLYFSGKYENFFTGYVCDLC